MEAKNIKEVEFKFDDGYYTVRPGTEGDTILGGDAHKIMFKMMEHERAHNSESVYRFSFSDKVKFILERSEYILNPDLK